MTDLAELEMQGRPVEDELPTPESEAPKVEAVEEKPAEVVVEATESPIVEPPPQPTTPDPEDPEEPVKEAPKPWKKPVRPMRQRKANGDQRGVRRSRR